MLLVSMSILSLSIYAQEVPTITVSKGDKIHLTVSPLGGSDGAAATKTLQNDLTLSGYFILGGNASYTTRWSITAAGQFFRKAIAAARVKTRIDLRMTLSKR